jgi:hypothetical protein
MDAIIGLAGGLVGVLVGALLSAAFTARRARVDRTFEMHREFEGPDMREARYRASELLEAHPGATFAELRITLGRTEMNDVWAVTGFYQRLWLGIRHHAVQSDLVPDLFGDTLLWWCDNSFRSQLLATGGERAYHIGQLEDWMLHHSSSATVARWREGNKLSPISGSSQLSAAHQNAASSEEEASRP